MNEIYVQLHRLIEADSLFINSCHSVILQVY